MHIGLTYDLRDEYIAAGYSEEETAEFDRESTIEAIDAALVQLGHRTSRIGHAKQLIDKLAAGERWDLVFNICEGMHGLGREAQVPAILDVYNIPYTFADPLVMSVCLHKGLTKMVVRDAHLATPKFLVVERSEDLTRWLRSDNAATKLAYPLFAKPVAEGTGKGVTPASRVADPSQLVSTCQMLLERFQQPVLVEEFLPGREFTVGLVGTGSDAAVLGTLEIVLLAGAEADVYSYVNKEKCEELVQYLLVRPTDPQVAEAEALALAAWRALGCRDGGRIDVRCDAEGHPQFIEANPLAGLHPAHSDLPMIATAVGMSYEKLLKRLVNSAKTRVATSCQLVR
jgi:D-alanine-D-alanine ligase